MKKQKAHQWPNDLGNEFHDLQELALNIDVNTGELKGSWGNLGYWFENNGSSIKSYHEAAENLAQKLGEFAQLKASHTLLDVGFGCGDQILHWQESFSVTNIWGINVSQVQTNYAQNKVAHSKNLPRLVQGDAGCDAVWESLPKHFDKIIALDCAYHFSNKENFFFLSAKNLSLASSNNGGGQLVMSDLVLAKPLNKVLDIILLKLICLLSHIPFHNLKTQEEYEKQLNLSGLVLAEYSDISSYVMAPFSNWIMANKNEIKKSLILNDNKTVAKKISWSKYSGTALFLRWAVRRNILQYAFLRIISCNDAHSC